MNFWDYLCIINFFLKNQQNAHNYPDKISGYPRKYPDIRYPTDIRYIVFEFDIRTKYPYSYPLSEKSPDIRKFHPNQCSPSSNPDPDGYFPNHITSLQQVTTYDSKFVIYLKLSSILFDSKLYQTISTLTKKYRESYDNL
jgi:hypothetical protein